MNEIWKIGTSGPIFLDWNDKIDKNPLVDSCRSITYFVHIRIEIDFAIRIFKELFIEHIIFGFSFTYIWT